MPIKRTLWRSLLLSGSLLATTMAWAQNNALLLKRGGDKKATVLTPTDTTHLNYLAQIRQFPLLATGQASIGTYNVPWLTATMQGDNVLRLTTQTNYTTADRIATIPLMVGDQQGGSLIIKQLGFDAAARYSLFHVPIMSATGNSQSSSEGIEKSFDGDLNTFYHSPYSGSLPQTLEYNLATPSHVDQIIYTPRQDGNTNGNWGRIVVSYSLGSAPNTFITLGTYDCNFSQSTTAIDMGVGGTDDVKKVRIVVESGGGIRFASAAEVAFVQNRTAGANTALAEAAQRIFTDELCSALRPGVTADDINTLTEPLLKSVAHVLLAGNYDTEFRRNTFEPYEPVEQLRNRLKLQHLYNSYENPTGIYFEAGKPVVVFVRGIVEGHAPSLKIKNWGKANASEAQNESSYSLRNGINVITPSHRGNGYVAYYDTDHATLPNVDIHFYAATVNGYFDPNEGHDNAKWRTMLNNAKSDIMDMRGTYVQMAYPVQRLRENCPTDGLSVVQHSDSTVRCSRDILGFFRYGINPNNRQFSHVVWGGFMHADNSGANVVDGSVGAWATPSAARFDFWSYGHELGHNSQLWPDFKYAGLGETSNNIFSAWSQFLYSTANFYRLESEVTGINNYAGMKGGRFNCYLEEGVRKGVSWQLQNGPDYSGSGFDRVTVPNEGYDGNRTGRDTTVLTKNFDHFVKLVPLWQLQLYCHQAGFSPDIWAKLHQAWRTTTMNNGTPSSGKYQIRFMQLVCDSTKMNFLPFFEKAGLLRPINAYIQDYSPDWLKIDQKMIDDLKADIQRKGYPALEGVPEYISALNWKTYRDRKAIPTATVNAGTSKGNNRVVVQHSVWQNVVAFETYDASGNLTAISMQGLGGDAGNTYTQVLFPSGSKRIAAVSWDGQRITCYQE